MPPPTLVQNSAQKSLTLVEAMCGNSIQTLIFSKQAQEGQVLSNLRTAQTMTQRQPTRLTGVK